MSIPKQPRQLMINIMYLVLTALLALNVSAEIFNAFKMVNKGLEASNSALDKSNADIPQQIIDGSKKKKEYEKYGLIAKEPSAVSKEFTSYVEAMVNDLIDKAGNKNGTVDDGDYIIKGDKKELKGKKDKDVTTRNLVNGGKGLELKNKIIEARNKFMSFIDEADKATFANEVTLNIDDESWKHSTKKSWEEFTFKQMPLGACQPIFSKIINDAKSTENAVLNYLLSKVGTDRTVILDKFTVVSAPYKSYVIKGEKFETEVFMSASASAASNTGISISVNGANLPVNADGVAKWTSNAGDVGVKKYSATVSMKNPVTGEVQTFKKDFEYEVGERSCNVSAKKMNVFYIGVDNPVGISAAGVPTNQLKVDASGAGIVMSKTGAGDYNVTVAQQGEANITLSGGGLTPTTFKFRAKRIPTPIPQLSGKTGGAMPNGTFKAQQGIIPVLEGFDFDAKCAIGGFRLVRIAPRQDPEFATNQGGRFTGEVEKLINKARPGDRYIFEEIKARCPGDQAGRELNEMSFKIQ